MSHLQHMWMKGGLVPMRSYSSLPGSLPACRVILEIAGSSVLEDRDSENRTPLILATMAGHGEVVNHLLSEGGQYRVCFSGAPEPWFNIKMPSYQYRKSHCGGKTVVRSSYLHNGVSYAGKMTSLYWIRAQGPFNVKLSHLDGVVQDCSNSTPVV